MTLTKKLTKIQTEFKSKKSRYNSFGKYYFRSAEDILEATKPFLKELDIIVTVNEELISFDPPVMQVTARISDGGEFIESKAVVGVDLDQKGMQMPQKFGSASSYGKKYALGNLFLIDDTQDSDATNTHDSNKPELKGEALTKAKKFLAEGGKLEAIKSKYRIPAATLKTL
mgnify:CR=1 FL=1|jgi:hypothetical protein